MKAVEKMNDISLRAGAYSAKVLTALGLGAMVGNCFADGAGTDYMQSLKPDIHATFGSGSVVEYVLLGAEALSIIALFTKTKNYMVFGGLPILMAFTHWALK